MTRVVINRTSIDLEEASFSCPVNAFRKNGKEYVINNEECIDCGVCQSMVADQVILEDSEANESDIKFNAEKSQEWNNVQ